jgi:malonate transporter
VQGVLEGFVTISLVIALGFLLAHLRLLGADSQFVLANLAFFVASPALMVTVLGEADIGSVFSTGLGATAASVLIVGLAYVVVAKLAWRKPAGELIIGTLSSIYVNAGNLGIPIAAYVLGDAALVAPILLVQTAVLQPLSLAGLDSIVGGTGFSLRSAVVSAVTNPLTLGSLLGLTLALTDTSLPLVIHDPLALVGGMAVPAMLLAYGVSLRLEPRPISGGSVVEITTIAVLKVVAQPLVAYLIARFVLGVDGTALYAVTVLAALPTAHNIFITATRYDTSVVVARDTIFLTTVLSIPALFVVSAFLALPIERRGCQPGSGSRWTSWTSQPFPSGSLKVRKEL